MKRALLLMMVASLILAGCFGIDQVDDVVDGEVPVTPMTSDQVTAAIALANTGTIVDLNESAAVEVYVKTVDDNVTSVVTAIMATDPATNSTRMQVSGSIGGISMDLTEISGPAGINYCAGSGATAVCTYARGEAYENPFEFDGFHFQMATSGNVVDYGYIMGTGPHEMLPMVELVTSWTVATDGPTHTATGSDAAFEYTVIFSGIPPALELMEMREKSGQNVTRFSILDPASIDFTVDTSMARISFSLEATESWWADTVADDSALFDCDDGSTVAFALVNDDTDDCADGSDEHREDTRVFDCDDGGTVLFLAVNDRYADCTDGSDERPEDTRADVDCADGTESIIASYVNDGYADCTDGSDEDLFICEDDDWPLPFSDVNDGIEDCFDGEDEDDGTGTMLFTCDDDSTIDMAKANDNSVDCADGSDEMVEIDCADGTETIYVNWYNDLEEDCTDGSDESLDTRPDWECEDGGYVSAEELNNHWEDCTDGSDETIEFRFVCDEHMSIGFWMANDGDVDCINGIDELPTITSYTIAGEISEDHGDRISLTEVDLELGKAGSPLEQLTLSDGSVSVTDSSGDTWDVTYNDNDNDGFISPGDTYQILTSSNTQDLSVTFHDTWAGNVADYERAPASLAYKCECIPQQGWSIVPDPPAPDPILNTCPTCTSSADCSYGGCVLEKDSNPNLTKPQGCRWVTFHMLSADVIAQGTISNN